MRTQLSMILTALLVVALTTGTQADPPNFTSAQSGYFTNSGTWNESGFPDITGGSTDSVMVSPGHTVTLQSSSANLRVHIDDDGAAAGGTLKFEKGPTGSNVIGQSGLGDNILSATSLIVGDNVIFRPQAPVVLKNNATYTQGVNTEFFADGETFIRLFDNNTLTVRGAGAPGDGQNALFGTSGANFYGIMINAGPGETALVDIERAHFTGGKRVFFMDFNAHDSMIHIKDSKIENYPDQLGIFEGGHTIFERVVIENVPNSRLAVNAYNTGVPRNLIEFIDVQIVGGQTVQDLLFFGNSDDAISTDVLVANYSAGGIGNYEYILGADNGGTTSWHHPTTLPGPDSDVMLLLDDNTQAHFDASTILLNGNGRAHSVTLDPGVTLKLNGFNLVLDVLPSSLDQFDFSMGGQIVDATIPEPATVSLLLIGSLALARRRRGC